jgi:hypothetical protein
LSKKRRDKDEDHDACVIGALVTDPLYLPDNVVKMCSDCRRMVQLRPHAPDVRVLCHECAKPVMEDPLSKLVVLPRMIADYKKWRRSKAH